jgi:hypothetical protein
MNQKQNRAAVAALVAGMRLTSVQPARPSILRDPHALQKVRRKMQHAIEAAQQAERHFWPCFPESTGPDTSNYIVPMRVVDTADTAHTYATTMGTFDGDPPVIDRTPIIRRQQEALRQRIEARMAPPPVAKLDAACTTVGSRVEWSTVRAQERPHA